MNKQDCVKTMEVALNYLGWEGGVVRQVVDELRRRTGVERTTTLHVYIRDMLVQLGVNEMSKLVYGVGFNDKTRPAKFDGKIVKEYDLWHDMLKRCYSEKFLATPRGRTYKGCSVSDNFLNYTFFYDWCQEQIGFGNIDEKGRSWQLDKDLLFVGNKTYSETACIFLPQEINSFFTDCGNARGEYPVGVCFDKQNGKFKAYCRVNSKKKNLGYFNTPEEAFAVYKTFKEALCKQLALKWQSEIDTRLFNAMMKWEVKNVLSNRSR